MVQLNPLRFTVWFVLGVAFVSLLIGNMIGG